MQTKNYFSLLLLFLSITLTAQVSDMSSSTDNDPSKNSKFLKINNNIYLAQSDGGNMGVYFGKDDIFMVDSQTFSNVDNNLKIIKRISKKPIKYLVNTSFHPDHNGGNKKVAKEGALIISHENTRNKINKLRRSDSKKISSGLSMADITFSKNMTIYFNNEKVEIIPVGNSKSNGDVMVFFTKSNVLFTGDIFYSKNKYPLIDINNGRSAEAMLSGLNTILKTSNATTKIIPGHGDAANTNEVNASINMLTAVFKRVLSLRENGKTIDEVLQSKSSITGRFDNNGFGSGEIKSDDFIRSIYSEIEKNKGPLDTRSPQEKANARLKEIQKENASKKDKN